MLYSVWRARRCIYTSTTTAIAGDVDIAGPRTDPALRAELALDPPVGVCQPLLERNLRLPLQHRPEACVVAVPPPHPLGLGQVVPAPDGFPRGAGHEVHQLVDRHQPVGTEVERLRVPRSHQANDALYTVFDVTVGACLVAVAPDLDLAAAGYKRNFATNSRRRFLAPALVRAQRAVDVVEPHDAGVEAMVLGIVPALPFAEQLFPPVSVLRIGRVRVLLFERSHIGLVLEVLRVDARGGCVQKSPDPGT